MSEIRSTNCRLTRRRLVTAAAGGAAAVLGRWPMSGHGADAQASGYTMVLVPGETAANYFYIPMACGAQDAAAELGVTLSEQGPAYSDEMRQAEMLAEIVAAGPDAILIAPSNSASMVAPIQEAIDAGIAVITLDAALDADIALAHVATDNREGGRTAARLLAEAIGGDGKVVVVSGGVGIASLAEREAGFAEAIAAYPNIEFLGVERDDLEDASTIVLDTLRDEPDLAGIFATYLTAGRGAGVAVAQAGAEDRVKVVAFDVEPEVLGRLEAGTIAALIAQHPYDMGDQAVRLAVEYLETGRSPADSFVDSGFTVITAGDLEGIEAARSLYVLSCDEIRPERTSAAATPIAATPAASLALAEFVREIPISADASGAPGGIAVDAQGTIYVADTLNNLIRVFDRDGQAVSTWGSAGTGPGQFRFQGGGGFWGDLALGPDGNLYVLDTFNNRVQVLAADGAYLREWGETGSGEGQLSLPEGLAIDGGGRVYVADSGNARVQVFDDRGQFLFGWETSPNDPVSEPADVAVDAAGTVWVTDYARNVVYRFAAGADPSGMPEQPGKEVSGFVVPWGAAVDAAGAVYVADYVAGHIQVVSPDGTLLGTVGSPGSEPGKFLAPIYVTIGQDGLLYVADETNRRVQVFRLLPPRGAEAET